MKCPVSTCGAEGPDRYCQVCGTETVEEVNSDAAVICNGTCQDGKICLAELSIGQNFCMCCGNKVDETLFSKYYERCYNCGHILAPGKHFCGQCGKKNLTQSQKSGEQSDNSGTPESSINEQESLSENNQHSGNEVVMQDVEEESIKRKNLNTPELQREEANFHEDTKSTESTESNDLKETDETYDNEQSFADCESIGDCSAVSNANVGYSIENITSTSENDSYSQLEQVKTESMLTDNAPITIKETEKETVSIDSEDDSSFDESVSTATSMITDNDLGTGNNKTKRKKKQKKNKKKRKKDREKINRQGINLQHDSSDGKQVETSDMESESKQDKLNQVITDQDVSDQTQDKEVERDGRIFGMAKKWKKSEASDKLTPGKSSLFSIDSNNENTDEKIEGENETEKDADSLLGPVQDKSTDKNKSSTDTENYTDDENMQVNEQIQNENKQGDVRESDVKETDIDTGQTVPVSRIHTKKKKKKKKKNKDNRNIEDGSTDRGTGMSTRSTTRNTTELWPVKFHVLTSEHFMFDPAKYKVYIVMGHPEMGGWKNKGRLMKVERKLEEYVYELVYETTLDFRLINESSFFPYKYYFEKENKEGKYEHYVKVGKTGEDINRLLTISQKYKCFGEWHQYDGFAEREPETFSIGKVKQAFGRTGDLEKHAEKAVYWFCSQVFDIEVSNSDVLRRLKMLHESLRRVYCLDARCWYGNREFVDFFGKNLIKGMFEVWSVDGNKSLGAKGERLNVLNGCFLIVCILNELEISKLDPKLAQKLCKAMLIRREKDEKECQEYLFVERKIQEERNCTFTALLYLVKMLAGKTQDPSWLYLMPWIHFLSGVPRPFEVPIVDVSHDSKKPFWWGIAEIDEEIQSFKSKTGKWTIKFEEVLQNLEPIFEMDFLLPRTFMASVALDNIDKVIMTGKIPTEVCLANLTYHVRVNTPDIQQYYYYYWFPTISSKEKKVCKCLEILLNQLNRTAYSEPCNITQWTMCSLIASSLFKECTSADRTELFHLSVQTLLHCLAMFHRCMVNKDEEVQHMINTKTSEALTWMLYWHYNWDSNMQGILKTWNFLFAPKELQSEKVRDEWNNIISKALSKELKDNVCFNSKTTEKFIYLYCTKLDEYNPTMQDCLSKSAFEAISKGFSVNNNNFSREENFRYGSLLSSQFESEWKKHVQTNDFDRDKSILQHVLNWAPFPQYLKIYYNDQENTSILKNECRHNLSQAVNVIADRVSKLYDGSITVGDLNMLDTKDQIFSQLSELVCQNEFVTKVIQLRQKEMNAFKIQAKEMSTLAALCQHLQNVDRSAIDNTLQKLDNMDVYAVKEFCKPVTDNSIPDIDQYAPTLCAFTLPQKVLHMVPQLYVYNKSTTFFNFWQDRCKDVNDDCDSLEYVVKEVWIPVKNRLDELSKTITSGEIKFREFEKHIGRIYGEDYEKMIEELQNMKVTSNKIPIRLDQLKKYRKLSTCVKGANTILTFAAKYKLEGDFEQIKVIATQSDINLEMSSFDDSVIKACAFLSDLTTAKKKCLDTFNKCEPLVQWLKKSMEKEGLKELKVFVDLALMSAGEDRMNIARVQCLHASVTGYAPLIFDLKQTSNYEELLQHCAIVWKELGANPNLPQQLLDTNNQLQWLKEIKKAHGSVEVTSLMQAEAINANGIFTVGKNALRKDMKTEQYHGMVLSDTLILTVLEQEGRERNYTFHQLQDLHSRLMLVAGKAEKGNDNVERFSMIFDSTMRLCNVYMKLCSSGCVLFKDLSARFYCDPERPVCIKLIFGQGENRPHLKGRRSSSEDLKDIIPELANFMENCYIEWLNHIKNIRKSYLHLNYFTVDQLVILQRELVKVGTEARPDLLIYPLLSAVKGMCTPDDILDAMAHAKEEIDGNKARQCKDIDKNYDDDNEMLENATDDEKKQNFIQEILSAGYDEYLAVRALEFIDPEDISAGVVWCMDHDEDLDVSGDAYQVSVENQPQTGHLKQIPTFIGWSQSETDIQTMITTNISRLRKKRDEGSVPLISELTGLWKQFLESISSNIRDYLSLEHLGLILTYLARKDTSKISRSLPPCFMEGQPNLIICPSGDVLMTTLSVYMMDRDQPLPQSDEILMCTSNTTIDEVDIFWRRAIFDGGRKIHCLVNVDMLDYDVSEAAERCLEEHLLEVHYKELQYRLLVICGSDNEYRSTIVSSLDKFKRQPLPANTAHLQEYLANKLTVQEHDIVGVRPAACVDLQRSTVRVIKSWRAGVGKTLFKQRREEELSRLNVGTVKSNTVSIPLQEKTIDLHYVIGRLLEHTTQPGEVTARLFHIDVSHEVENGVDFLLFNLLVLGCLVDKTGFVWRKSPTDIYLIETMPLMMHTSNIEGADLQYVHPMLKVLPDMTCRSPQESVHVYLADRQQGIIDLHESDQLFDGKQFRSEIFQRTFQYLLRLDQGRRLDDIHPKNPEGKEEICLQTLLRHCGLEDPSWSELHHFVWFLNTQLVDFENNMFVSAAAAEDLPGFSKFVLRFLIQMSRDFSTRSLNMSEESSGVRTHFHKQAACIDDWKYANDAENDTDIEEDLQVYQMKRTWESSPHPYLFFNSDRSTFTFLGFFIDRSSGNLIDQQTRAVLEKGIMAQNLYDSLIRNQAPMQENFEALPRDKKILKLCNVMGIKYPHDPDDTYELTTDNVKKILAIYMRFRCDIPVIIMGETGCGKTRLVKFMCSLQQPPGVDMTNMILMKVHGGTTNKDIIKKVRDAERIAKENKERHGNDMYTVLFFDEANTTEAIGLIKEIMCDKSMEGQKLKLCENLKIVAACNPYRKHSEELITKLEQAGLGYHVDADETTDRLGRVPMRRLVYRVQPLPQSLLPLVWDFGQLNTQVEDLYIRQMVRRYIRKRRLPEIGSLVEVVSAVLTASQDYMRAQKDECSFVSLRDVERVLTVMSWFYQQSEGDRTLYQLMDDKLYGEEQNTSDEEEEEEDEKMIREDEEDDRVDDVTRSLILALGVCYHACLKTRPQYRAHIAQHFRAPCDLPGGENQIEEEIKCCQEVFLDHVHLEKNIARNMALRENVFMMIVCIEQRIPLFLVGKPGSSKSLAKTIVSDAMQGNAAREKLFRELKQAQMVSFQCSPLATPDGIVGTFRQCAQFQKDKDLNTFVSVVVLDEVGLAEDSPRMPLKTLHPLLEDGCQGDEIPEKYKKVAFIGISNWALDPAKMNRGILVQREVPDLDELIDSANGICNTDDNLDNFISPLIRPMAISYIELFKKASQSMREFYGLRDFYSLVKMVYGFVERSKQPPTWHEMLHSIKRNFGGLDRVKPEESFRKHLATVVPIKEKRKHSDPDCTPAGLVQACLFDREKMNRESRYLLLLTENYGTLTIIQQQILSRRGDIRPITIFGSSFRSDQEYTQVCRNINKIKVCMETGKTVVLLNLENLYESLYDVLNQYYVYFGGERFVDLGLGTHRVKCPVHKHFRLIVVAEKQTVYEKFPIPLINRLEKHFLTINTILSPEQQKIVNKLEGWAKQFVKQRNLLHVRREKTAAMKVGDVFIGYHDDTCAAIVLDVWDKHAEIEKKEERKALVLQEAKAMLIWCATPESLVKLEHSGLSHQERKALNDLYKNEQSHDSILQYLYRKIYKQPETQLFAQITTHSKLMAVVHKKDISEAIGIHSDKILLLENLSSFDTEQQFSNRIQKHIRSTEEVPSLIMVQCDSGNVNANLIACARYCVMDELEKLHKEIQAPIHIVFIVQLQRGATFNGFQCGLWHSAHIDDLYPEDMNMPTLQDMQGKSISKLFADYIEKPTEMETDQDIPIERSQDPDEMEWNEAEESCEPLRQPMDEDITNTNEINLESRSRNEPLQLDDVPIYLRYIDGGLGFDEGQQKLNVKGLILSCVQGALSMVKDKIENTHKETDRVGLVLSLLHQEQVEAPGQLSFLHGVCCLLAKLLKEKETKTHIAHMAQNWLVNEAASSENINKAGTFRRSCIQTLQSKLTPFLAGIIAYLDTNDNLKILQKDSLNWKHRLWLTCLNTAEALTLQYTDLQSPKRQSDLLEVVVMTTGCEGQMFSAKMPFSWLIFTQINEILKLPHPVVKNQEEIEYTMDEDNIHSKIESSVKALSNHALGKIFSCISNEHDVTEAVQEYIYDFVQTMYKAASEYEEQLVYQTILYVTTQMAHTTVITSLLHSMVTVHIAYQKLATRLTYFRAMNSVWPECSFTIIDLKAKNPDHFMFKEQEFTFSALCLLLETLTPKGTDLNDVGGRSHWLSKVHRYRPVVEKVIRLHNEDPALYGVHNVQSVRRAKGLWNRVMVVKLFLEHVCASDSEDKITIKHCMPLWTLLGEETNLKEMRSLEAVEKFLKSCNKQALKIYVGDEIKCCDCESILEGPPIALPCLHVLCHQCFADMKQFGEEECAVCHQTLPDNWQPEHQSEKKINIVKLNDYQKRCNTFFMDIASQLCFADYTAPSQEVVQKLLYYIFFTTRGGDHQRTRDLSIFNTGIDPTPVFRSFLLQLLMRTSKDDVLENLGHYLSQAKQLIEGNVDDQEQQYLELCLLVIQCLEDMFTQEASKAEVDEIYYACAALHRANENIGKEGLNVEKLYGLASARMGLAITARCVADIVMTDTDPRHVERPVRKLIEAAQKLYEKTHIKWIRIYLVKHLCRCYGVNVYQAVCRNAAPFLQWISMNDSSRDQVVEVSDRYIVCGEHYKRIREAITKVILGENVQHLFETVQELQASEVRVEPILQLAVHREITNSYLYSQHERKLKEPVIETLNIFFHECNVVANKQLMQMLITNQLVPRHLRTVEGEDLRLQGLQCLIVHYISVMMSLKGDRTLLQPLQTLMSNPQACVNMFLPSMPQDDLQNIKEAVLAARDANENPAFYRCPNGHPYYIGDCGRPYVVSKCKCGADIGGQGHKLLPTNTQDTGTDNTLTGHILGRAKVSGQGPVPERTMSPAVTATIRLILHMSMLIGAGENLQGVQSLIKPDVDIAEVVDFIWAHIQQDVDDLHRVLGRSVDDVLLLMHAIINIMFRVHDEENYVSGDLSQLSSKYGRNEWEAEFCTKFLQTSFKNIENILNENNVHLVQDHRLGADPLLCLLHETDNNEQTENLSVIEEIPKVWRYRTPISLQHLKQEVEAKLSQNQHKVLQLFLKEDHYLRALRYIPSILRLHRALFQKYQRKLDKAEASQITVGQLKKEGITSGEINNLLQDFADAWALVRESLMFYSCPTERGCITVPKDYCGTNITDRTPISMLLPTTKEEGLCSYSLLDFLMRKQNDFLDKYMKETDRKSESVSSVKPSEVTSAHLISYDPQHDILPLVLANCQYTFEMGQGTRIQYDFAALERQLMDRFLFSKSRIDIGRILMIDQMMYRREFTNAEVFRKLEDKIHQESLSSAVKTQICAEIRTLPDICTSLDNLDITISFLKSTGGPADKTLHEFMETTLQMKTTILSQKAQQTCNLKHAKSLWLLMSQQKSKKMAEQKHHTQEIFENVPKEFHKELPRDIMTDYIDFIKKLSIDKLSQLVEVLHEYILLVVAVIESPENEDHMDTTNHRLALWLCGYIEVMDSPVLDLAELADFPLDILYAHSVKTWICTYNMLVEKQTGTVQRFI